MRIAVKVKANAKENKIERIDQCQFSVRVKAKPQRGKANQAVIKILAEYFDVAQSDVKLLWGHTSREKQFEIEK